MNNEKVHELLEHTGLILLDVKHNNDEWHRKLTGLTNKNTLALAAYRESTGKPMWLRYVLVPGWTDQEEYVEEWARHFKGHFKGHFKDYKIVQRVEILPFHQYGKHKWEALGMNYALKDLESPSEEVKQRTFYIFSKYLDHVVLK